ncbi:MAG: hypothetical protein JXA77_11225 [Bacteroidales bacterium]|nr:hypothetical protein [Bacteroidales bacterium]MBN2819064.1 hypothetical protein [Bacteroidales bacterium]
MEKKNNIIAYYIIASSILWGLTIVVTAFLIKSSENATKAITIMGVAAALHLILIWGPLAAQMKKQREGEMTSKDSKD